MVFCGKNYWEQANHLAQLSYIIECVHTHKRVFDLDGAAGTVFPMPQTAISDHKACSRTSGNASIHLSISSGLESHHKICNFSVIVCRLWAYIPNSEALTEESAPHPPSAKGIRVSPVMRTPLPRVTKYSSHALWRCILASIFGATC